MQADLRAAQENIRLKLFPSLIIMGLSSNKETMIDRLNFILRQAKNEKNEQVGSCEMRCQSSFSRCLNARESIV